MPVSAASACTNRRVVAQIVEAEAQPLANQPSLILAGRRRRGQVRKFAEQRRYKRPRRLVLIDGEMDAPAVLREMPHTNRSASTVAATENGYHARRDPSSPREFIPSVTSSRSGLRRAGLPACSWQGRPARIRPKQQLARSSCYASSVRGLRLQSDLWPCAIIDTRLAGGNDAVSPPSPSHRTCRRRVRAPVGESAEVQRDRQRTERADIMRRPSRTVVAARVRASDRRATRGVAISEDRGRTKVGRTKSL